MMKYQCPCCGYFTYNVPANEDCGYICPICFWENDPFIASDNEPSDSSAFVDWRWTKMKNDTIFLYLIASVSFLFCSNCAGRHNKTVEFGLAAQNGGFEITISEPPFTADTFPCAHEATAQFSEPPFLCVYTNQWRLAGTWRPIGGYRRVLFAFSQRPWSSPAKKKRSSPFVMF